MATSQVPPEPEPAEGDSTVPSDTSPPWVLKSHHWHLADYVKLPLEEGRRPEYGGQSGCSLGNRGIYPLFHNL